MITRSMKKHQKQLVNLVCSTGFSPAVFCLNDTRLSEDDTPSMYRISEYNDFSQNLVA